MKVPQEEATSLVPNLSIIYMHLLFSHSSRVLTFYHFPIEVLSLLSYFEVETWLECFEWPVFSLSSLSGLPSSFFRLKFFSRTGAGNATTMIPLSEQTIPVSRPIKLKGVISPYLKKTPTLIIVINGYETP